MMFMFESQPAWLVRVAPASSVQHPQSSSEEGGGDGGGGDGGGGDGGGGDGDGGGGGDEVGASSHDADHRHDDWPLAIMLPSHFAAPCRPIVAHVAAS